jgi:hypothetical protein
VKHKDAPANYAISSAMRDEFATLLKSEKFEYSSDSLSAAHHWVETAMRRELARRFVGDEEAYRVALEDDEQVRQSAALFDKAATLPKLLALATEMNKAKAMAVQGRGTDLR